jgi:hypothetical protein
VPYSQLSLEFYVCTDQSKRQGGIDDRWNPQTRRKAVQRDFEILDVQLSYIIGSN